MNIEFNNNWLLSGYYQVEKKRNLINWVKWHIKPLKPIIINFCLLFAKPLHIMIYPIIFGISFFCIDINYYDISLAILRFEIKFILHPQPWRKK